MTFLKLVFILTLLSVVTGFPSRKWSEGISDPFDLHSAGTGKNWLTPYVSLLSSVIPSDETGPSIPAGAEKPTRDPRSSDRLKSANLQQRSSNCQSVLLKHPGKKVPLIRPTTGNIYKNKSHGDPERYAAHVAARAAVSAHSHVHHDGALVSISNPRIRGTQTSGTPRRLDICSTVWSVDTPQRQRTEVDPLLEFWSTYEVPEPPKSTTPTTPVRPTPVRPTPVRPTVEAVVAECNLPPPYQDDRYDWLEVLAGHGGLPGCVNSTQQPPPQRPVTAINDTCERPLAENFPGEVLYTYMQSDLHSFYRYEIVNLRFPGKPNQFVDVRGFLVWTSPPDDGNVYVVEYFYDDSGLWVYIPEHTCRFVDTATLTCTTRQLCYCKDGKETCLAVQGLPGNLLATLVGGGR